ncbi:uncharacterized protein C9orf153 homolog isoform 2-T2 [Thomomys bottae]
MVAGSVRSRLGLDHLLPRLAPLHQQPVFPNYTGGNARLLVPVTHRACPMASAGRTARGGAWVLRVKQCLRKSLKCLSYSRKFSPDLEDVGLVVRSTVRAASKRRLQPGRTAFMLET